MYTEQTQFSMAELTEFLKVEVDPSGAGCNKREQAMLAFSREVIDFSNLGGEGNIQRVRVLADAKDPSLPVRYEYITKLPVQALAYYGFRPSRVQYLGMAISILGLALMAKGE